MERILVFKEDSYLEFPLVEQLKLEDTTLQITNGVVYYTSIDGEKIEMSPQIMYTNRKDSFVLLSTCKYQYQKGDTAILIGKENSDIELKQGHYVIDGKYIFKEEKDRLYVNGKRQLGTKIAFLFGDQVLINNHILLIVHEQYITIIGQVSSYTCHLPYFDAGMNVIEGFPEYKRSPRVIKRLKNDKITISKPPNKIERKKNSLVKVIVPPVVMAVGTVVMSLMMGRGVYMLIGLAGTVVSLIFSVTAFFSEQKELKEKSERRNKVYEKYLLNIRKKLDAYRKEEIEALQYNYPTLSKLEEMVIHHSPRMYERDCNDDDFLMVTVGKMNDRSEYIVSLDYDALETEKDDLLEEAKEIYKEYQIIKDKAVSIDLKKGHLGIVGEKNEIHEQIKWLLSQITFFHSYHDVQIIMLYNDTFKNGFEYIRWYPHVKIHANNLTGNIHNERVRDQVLGSLYQILKERKSKRDENKKEMSFLPHFVIIVDEPHLIMNHSIMEYLQEDSTELGFSLVYTAQKRANLPENISTVLTMEDMNTATLLLNEGIEVNKRLEQQRIGTVDLENMARHLNALLHIQGISSHIPEAITFFDMYKVKSPAELDILNRWQNSESHKSLSVPLGVRAIDDVVELNLHEKAHGPHGLVAGTTGSGKSEIIQSYILSLAVNFSPYEVGFLLIDYKGGGMANLFKRLPHLLGTITNLDGLESMRALASIKAELARRQNIFNLHDVNTINKYNQLFKSGKAKEPLPHLFLISDEFAELKKEQPEFMSELVSVARIGRTLGVHLILATQKPTGVVDDQIWSNSKFKLALKVQDENDSKEIIKTSDAAFITQAGRAYLQVGNNEIYELFQSAWSGAPYSVKEQGETIDTRIYQMNALGQGELINSDLSEDTKTEESMTTQLDAIVNYIDEMYSNQSHLEVIKPWLPSLATNISSPYIGEVEDVALIERMDLTCAIGVVDIPEQQQQLDYCLDFLQDGNLAIFASSGYGKSTTIGTILLTLAIKNNPKYLNFYILDFGNSSLIPYKMLPHTADYMTFDSEEKLDKFQKIISDEIKERKQLFAKEMVQNFTMYNQMHEQEPLKAIVIVIDNFDVVKEISMDFEDFIMKTTRDGIGLGIYTIISATRSNAVRFATLNNFKSKIVQYLFDEGEAMSLLGRSPYRLHEIKGRALIKQKMISMMQVYAPVAFENDMEFITHLKDKIQAIASLYTGSKVMGIPVLPDIFTTKDFSHYKCASSSRNLIGLSLDTVENISIDGFDSPYVIIGPAKSGKTNFLEILIQQATGHTYIFDGENMGLYAYRDMENMQYVNTVEEVCAFVENLASEVEMRHLGLEKAMANGKYSLPKEYFASLEDMNIYIDDVDGFITKVQDIPNITGLLQQASNCGIHIVASIVSTKLKGYDEVTKFFKNATSGAILGQMGTLSIFSLNIRDIPSFGYAVLIDNGEMQRVKLPKCVS